MSLIDKLRLHNDDRLYAEADILMAEAADEIERLHAVLKRIAGIDYRGNRSTESMLAYQALKHVPNVKLRGSEAVPLE